MQRRRVETSATLVVTGALLVVTRTLLGAPGLTTSNKKLLGTSASLLGARAFPKAPIVECGHPLTPDDLEIPFTPKLAL